MVSTTETSSVFNELKSLLVDELKVCTYKYLAKRFNIPYDISKQVLFQYQKEENDAVDVSFLISGVIKEEEGKTHVVKVVDGARLDECKASFARIDSLHVYSLSPKGVIAPDNLVEVDLAQNREALGTTLSADYASLGRVSLVHPPERHSLGAPRRRPDISSRMELRTAQMTKVETDMNKEMKEMKDRVEAEEKEQKVDVTDRNKMGAKKKRARMIDSDSDEGGDEGGGGPAKVKTYINDKGEEVTEIQSVEVKAQKPANTHRGKQKKPTAPKQKGIMGFFKPKQ